MARAPSCLGRIPPRDPFSELPSQQSSDVGVRKGYEGSAEECATYCTGTLLHANTRPERFKHHEHPELRAKKFPYHLVLSFSPLEQDFCRFWSLTLCTSSWPNRQVTGQTPFGQLPTIIHIHPCGVSFVFLLSRLCNSADCKTKSTILYSIPIGSNSDLDPTARSVPCV